MLTLYNNNVHSFFRLIGKDENALTSAFGFLLSERPDILVTYLIEIGVLKRRQGKKHADDIKDYSVHLQQHNDDKSGIKDIVIEDNKSNQFVIVIEAKVDQSKPHETQLNKYLKDSINKQWRNYKRKILIVLTRLTTAHLTDYDDLKGDYELFYSSWSQVYRVIYKNNITSVKSFDDRIINEMKAFIMKDYEITYFEHEVLHIHVKKAYHNSLCMRKDFGYYFNSSRPKYVFPASLFFASCTGPSHSSRKTAEFLRRIKMYDILSAHEILNSQDNDLVQAFNDHLSFHPSDQNESRIHVFVLSDDIKIPASKRKFDGPNYGYRKLTDFL